MKGMLASVLLLAGATVQAQDFESDGLFYQMAGEGTVKVVGGPGSQKSYWGTVVVPPMVLHDGQWFTVTGIGDEAFLGCRMLEEVQLPVSATHIGKRSFKGSGVKAVRPISTTLHDMSTAFRRIIPPTRPVPQVAVVPSDELVERYGSYFVNLYGNTDVLGMGSVMDNTATEGVEYQVCFDGLYGVSSNEEDILPIVNSPGFAFEAEDESRLELPVSSSDGEPKMEMEMVEDGRASGGSYMKLRARYSSDQASLRLYLRDLLPGKHYNVYCTVGPTPSQLPAFFTVRACLGSWSSYLLPLEERNMDEIPQAVAATTYFERAHHAKGTQFEAKCIAKDVQVNVWNYAYLDITSFGPIKTSALEVVYTRTLCFDQFEVRAFDSSEEAQADYAKWLSEQP